MPAIETIELTKHYVTHKKSPGIMGAIKGLVTREKTVVEAVKGVSFSIEAGELVGFLGPNGAGKTTTLKMLSGILMPTSGECSVLGFKPFERRNEMLRQIALVMGNKQQLWWDLPAWDSFVVLKELYDVGDQDFKDRTAFLFDALQIEDKIHTQVRKLSLGERMKCELVAALLHRPAVLFLDEPTLGLDVVSQKRIRDFLRELNLRDQCTMILTSHYMQDVEELCDRVIVIDHGSKVFDGTLKSLAKEYSDMRRLRLVFVDPPTAEELEPYGRVVSCGEEGAVIEIAREATASTTSAVLQRFQVADIGIEETEIEDVIRKLFSREQP